MEERLTKILGPARKGKDAISRTLAVFTMSPLLSALALEAKFDPALVGEEELEKLVDRLFDALL